MPRTALTPEQMVIRYFTTAPAVEAFKTLNTVKTILTARGTTVVTPKRSSIAKNLATTIGAQTTKQPNVLSGVVAGADTVETAG